MKNLITWQAIPTAKIGNIPDLNKYTPSNESIYAELFVLSTEEYYDGRDYERV